MENRYTHHSTSVVSSTRRRDVIRYINMKLASMGQPIYEGLSGADEAGMTEQEFIRLSDSLLNNYREKMRLLSDRIINPADRRIQNFINSYLQDIEFTRELRIPFDSFVLDKPEIGREVSLPPDKNEYFTEYVNSYRIRQGILHNPVNDRRTTQGSFHIVKGGLPIPWDKRAVPKLTFAHLLQAALNPPEDFLILPFTASQQNKAKVFASMLLRPVVCPEVKGFTEKKTMEIRFFVPGAFVSNLDFVETIFGNAGDPYLYKNDAALDIQHWTGHTGCIILAPHMTRLKKKDLGLPHWEDASERMRRDGMCWKEETELYNDGLPFKITCRDNSGVIVTLIADNYFGYSKKEIKTQISYAANLYGGVEEEHAGGALVFSRRNLGNYYDSANLRKKDPFSFTFEDIKREYSSIMDLKPENYGVDKTYPSIIYLQENARFDLYKSRISWECQGKPQEIKLLRNHTYVLPSGHKIHMEKHPFGTDWRLVATNSEGSFLHKPSTVSGGGKSEISKSLLNAINYGNFYADDLDKDFRKAEEILSYDYTKRWKDEKLNTRENKSFLDPSRTLGSVIKMLTPFEDYTDEYNTFLKSIPDHIKALVLLIKRIHREEGEGFDWKSRFSVDRVNGRKGHKLMYEGRRIVTSYLRVGFAPDTSWFVHSLRPDFVAAAKVQMEDDISATITLPFEAVPNKGPELLNKSLKLVENCEYLFFQRPDEAINRGYDKQAEEDLSRLNNFTTNYEPLSARDGQEIIEEAISFDKYTEPIKNLIIQGAADTQGLYFISPSHPRRLSDGSISKNPRYLQPNPNFSDPTSGYLAKTGLRFARKIPIADEVCFPITDVLPGRRNNPSNKKDRIRPLSVYNPIHYQELPELFMDFVCSLTGKSPSTTGAGSEGALTKGPFNMLPAITDLNNALLSYILTGYHCFTTPAGHIGPKHRFDHDISILIPELWCRLGIREKDPEYLIREGFFEKVEDLEYKGEKIPASRLGYRMTKKFMFKFFGRIFEEPLSVFSEEVLKPELQNLEDYVDGIKNICEAQKRVAEMYFEDGSIEAAVPPLKILLHIMAYGNYEGKDISDPELRETFTRQVSLESPWYAERLKLKQKREADLWSGHIAYIETFLSDPINAPLAEELSLPEKLTWARENLKEIESARYLASLAGTIGADPLYQCAGSH